MSRSLVVAFACAASLALPQSVFAHGGQYRGPGDVVPPNPGGSGGRTPGPGPTGPTTPNPTGPTTPNPTGPAHPTIGPTTPPGTPTGGPNPFAHTPGGGNDGPDLTKWQFWWEFNKDPFLNLKDSIQATTPVSGSDYIFVGGSQAVDAKDTLKPSEAQIRDQVLPALHRAIERTSSRDITSSCMIAMAKIGKNDPVARIDILDVFRARLVSTDQEIRETAALAMGISGQPFAASEYLIDLAKDTPKGRRLVDKGEVDDRTRAFACYSLGLVAWASSRVEDKAPTVAALESVLADSRISNRNVKVGAINGLRLIRPPTGEPGLALRKKCVDVLWSYYDQKLGKGEELIQAHVPPAIGRLLGRGATPEHQRFKDAFKAELDEESKRHTAVVQSCAIALGLMVERTKDDQRYVDALVRYVTAGKDQMTKRFAIMALGEIGGASCREALLQMHLGGTAAFTKPWSAIALGVLCHFARQEAGESAATVDEEAGRALRATLEKVRNPDAQAAAAIGLGLMQYTDAADDLRDMLVRNKHQEELAGYFAISLALMNDNKSRADIQNIVRTSVRKPDLLKQATIALGKLGDKSVSDTLQEMLTMGDANIARLSAVATAFGHVGDRRMIDPLVKLLFDSQISELARAFAAVALGGICDKELLPWNSKLSRDLNYRAAVETLTNQSTGILDIL